MNTKALISCAAALTCKNPRLLHNIKGVLTLGIPLSVISEVSANKVAAIVKERHLIGVTDIVVNLIGWLQLTTLENNETLGKHAYVIFWNISRL